MKAIPVRLPPRSMWTYGYIFSPPIARSRVGPIKILLHRERRRARRSARTWEGRLVNGDLITHLLIVCDSPAQDLEINVLLEAELIRLAAPFSRTTAMALETLP